MTETDSGHALYYTDDLIENLQLRWGEGFMSPGGAAELRRMLRGVEMAGARVLDLGCGIGGYDFLMVEAHDTAHVTGIDIDAASLATARREADRRGLQGRIDFRQAGGGVLPFADGHFDIVFSKDAIVDLPDKAPVFDELFRVTRPGGRVVIGDWFRSAAPYTDEMRAWATTGDETYEMQTLDQAANDLRAAGFTEIETDDRNAWYRDLARAEYARLEGPLHDTYRARFGEAQARASVENARIRWLLAEQVQLRPGHLRGRRP